MRVRISAIGGIAVACALALVPGALAAEGAQLEMYVLEGSAASIGAAARGLEVRDIEHSTSGTRAEAVLTPSQAKKIRAEGVKVSLLRNRTGQTATEQAARMALGGFSVWRSFDEPGGIRDELYEIAARNSDLVKLEVVGHTHQNREIIALRVTENWRQLDRARRSRPAVLYSSLQHGREWITAEVNRRTLRHFVDRYRAGDASIRNLLKTAELWFVVVANPDGYQYTFEGDRLWSKNLRNNDDNGTIDVNDGVDLDRNFDVHWGYDDEGSSNERFSETYRGPGPASEPETLAMKGLIDRIKPKFQSNLHSFGQRLLYPQGWQTGTLDADNPIYTALGGTDANPAIPGFNPGQAADSLYVRNGETTDYADTKAGTVAYTPELGEGVAGSGFVFPDDEGLVQSEFERLLPFHLGLARSAPNPADPVSPVGITVKPFYLEQDEIDPQTGQHSLFDFKFSVSYGDPQTVRVLAKRSLGSVRLLYRINGGSPQSRPTSQWEGGERYGPGNGAYYRVMQGAVSGAAPGDEVTVWFEGGKQRSDSFKYRVQADTGKRTLIVAAEDYTGVSPAKPGVAAPQYLDFYTDALDANGVPYDVYDVDTQGRTAPDNLGVLSHYDAVLWYTGDDVVTREPGWGPGNASRLAMQEINEVRDYLNEGGRALYTGQRAGQQYTTGLGTQLYDPFENRECSSDAAVTARCLPASGSGDSQGDPIEYWFGAATTTPGGGFDPNTGDPFPLAGLADPLAGITLQRNGPDSADNQFSDSSFTAIEDYLAVTDPTASFPQFESEIAAEYQSGIAGQFDPHTGTQFMWSQRANRAYKRLSRTITVPSEGATLKFWTSYNLEQDFDYLVVEAHTVGQDNWTTLPDANGHTSDDLSNDRACPAGWSNTADSANLLHPFLTHYQTFQTGGTCTNTGTSGQWHAANGSSSGWQQWSIDLAPYASQQVELAITVLTAGGPTKFPGVFIDDVEVSTGEGTTSFEDDGDPLDGWTVPGAPEDIGGVEGDNLNDWVRRGGFGIKEGAAITTPDSVYLGFGFEGISGAATRNDVMDRVVDYLLR